jgi:Uma2 family endonuclease
MSGGIVKLVTSSARALAPKTARARHLTLSAWSALPDDVEGELVDGLLEDEEIPHALHEAIVAWLVRLLGNHAVPRGGRVYGSELKYAVSTTRGRKPDVSVFLPGTHRPKSTDRLIRQRPDIVVEVITASPRDERRDRVAKHDEYARFGVPQYWLVHPELRTVEILRLGEDGLYARVAAGSTGKLKVPGLRGLSLDLDALWAETFDE